MKAAESLHVINLSAWNTAHQQPPEQHQILNDDCLVPPTRIPPLAPSYHGNAMCPTLHVSVAQISPKYAMSRQRRRLMSQLSFEIRILLPHRHNGGMKNPQRHPSRVTISLLRCVIRHEVHASPSVHFKAEYEVSSAYRAPRSEPAVPGKESPVGPITDSRLSSEYQPANTVLVSSPLDAGLSDVPIPLAFGTT